MPPAETRREDDRSVEAGGPQFLSTRTAAERDDKPEVLNKASELLKPLLIDPARAPQAAANLVAVLEHHKGPLPHPRILGGYEEIIPGAARDILEMARTEQRHRHKMENREILYPYVTLAFGGLALLGCIAGAVFLAHSASNTNVAIGVTGCAIDRGNWLADQRPHQNAKDSSAHAACASDPEEGQQWQEKIAWPTRDSLRRL